MARYLFFVSILLQIFGFLFVTKCLVSGLSVGDYGHAELYEFLGGSFSFYLGTVLKKRYQR